MANLRDKISKGMLKKKKIYIIPTRFGIIFIGGLFAMLLTAAAYANNLVYLLTFLLSAILLIAMAEAHNNMRSLFVYRVETEPGAEDETVKVKIWVKNDSSQPKFSIFAGFRKKDLKEVKSEVSLIPQKSVGYLELNLPVTERGVFDLPDIRLFTIFPLGLFYCWRIHKAENKYFVYPKPVGQQSLPFKKAGFGEEDNPLSVGGDDFRGHANYQQGESQKHIDWKAFARGRPLMVKKFDLGDPRIRHLSFDEVQGGTLETKLRQLSSWIWKCHRNQDVYQLSLKNKSTEPGLGIHHLKECLVMLAHVENDK